MWNYRILAFTQEDESVLFVVREVYDDEYGKTTGMKNVDLSLITTSKKQMRLEVTAIKKAMERPVLWGDGDKLFKPYKKLKKKII